MGKNFSLLDLIDADKPKELEVDEKLCGVHVGKKVKFYCEEDQCFVCSECFLENHIGHSIVASKPLILGEAVSTTLTASTDVIKKLQDVTSEHLKKITSTHRVSQVMIELVRD
jgi:hypothetical protein